MKRRKQYNDRDLILVASGALGLVLICVGLRTATASATPTNTQNPHISESRRPVFGYRHNHHQHNYDPRNYPQESSHQSYDRPATSLQPEQYHSSEQPATTRGLHYNSHNQNQYNHQNHRHSQHLDEAATSLSNSYEPLASDLLPLQPQNSRPVAIESDTNLGDASSPMEDEPSVVDSLMGDGGGAENGAASMDQVGDANTNLQQDQVAADNSQDALERNIFINHHNSRLKAMHDMFERRQLGNGGNSGHPMGSSQELSPISIGLDPVGAGSPFGIPPFSVGGHDGPTAPMSHAKAQMANADNLDQGLGPSLPFGLNPLPHLLGFQNAPFDGPQRGDQSAHSNHHATAPISDSEATPSQKVWPKIFRFTDGRINLSDFEKQKKIRLSNKNQHNTDNHIESAPIMFDGRQLKRKSFLILHGGIFSR